MALTIIKTNSENPDFLELVRDLDADLRTRDGEDHAFYATFNKTVNLKYTVVAYINGKPAGCGAIRELTDDSMEVKRMYVIPGERGKGIAAAILLALEKWALSLGFTKCMLETGKRQPEAIALYTKSGYRTIPNYGQYQQMDNSVCFEKEVGR